MHTAREKTKAVFAARAKRNLHCSVDNHVRRRLRLRGTLHRGEKMKPGH
eukprot:COSAG02_NODE_4520_length_5269_cov_3.784913_3_plen_49_part_00